MLDIVGGQTKVERVWKVFQEMLRSNSPQG